MFQRDLHFRIKLSFNYPLIVFILCNTAGALFSVYIKNIVVSVRLLDMIGGSVDINCKGLHKIVSYRYFINIQIAVSFCC